MIQFIAARLTELIMLTRAYKIHFLAQLDVFSTTDQSRRVAELRPVCVGI
jgi:hypothetical protein